jgi:hypothetical protein
MALQNNLQKLKENKKIKIKILPHAQIIALIPLVVILSLPHNHSTSNIS